MTPDDLKKCIFNLNLSEVEAMNILQDNGIISDLCVWAKDIHDSDIPRAIEFLTKNQTLLL